MPAADAATPVLAGLRAQGISTEDRVVWANNWQANQGFVDNIIITCVAQVGWVACTAGPLSSHFFPNASRTHPHCTPRPQ